VDVHSTTKSKTTDNVKETEAAERLAARLAATFNATFPAGARLGIEVTAADVLAKIREVLRPPKVPEIDVQRDPEDPNRVIATVPISSELADFFGLSITEATDPDN